MISWSILAYWSGSRGLDAQQQLRGCSAGKTHHPAVPAAPMAGCAPRDASAGLQLPDLPFDVLDVIARHLDLRELLRLLRTSRAFALDLAPTDRRRLARVCQPLTAIPASLRHATLLVRNKIMLEPVQPVPASTSSTTRRGHTDSTTTIGDRLLQHLQAQRLPGQAPAGQRAPFPFAAVSIGLWNEWLGRRLANEESGALELRGALLAAPQLLAFPALSHRLGESSDWLMAPCMCLYCLAHRLTADMLPFLRRWPAHDEVLAQEHGEEAHQGAAAAGGVDPPSLPTSPASSPAHPDTIWAELLRAGPLPPKLQDDLQLLQAQACAEAAGVKMVQHTLLEAMVLSAMGAGVMRRMSRPHVPLTTAINGILAAQTGSAQDVFAKCPPTALPANLDDEVVGLLWNLACQGICECQRATFRPPELINNLAAFMMILLDGYGGLLAHMQLRVLPGQRPPTPDTSRNFLLHAVLRSGACGAVAERGVLLRLIDCNPAAVQHPCVATAGLPLEIALAVPQCPEAVLLRLLELTPTHALLHETDGLRPLSHALLAERVSEKVVARMLERVPQSVVRRMQNLENIGLRFALTGGSPVRVLRSALPVHLAILNPATPLPLIERLMTICFADHAAAAAADPSWFVWNMPWFRKRYSSASMLTVRAAEARAEAIHALLEGLTWYHWRAFRISQRLAQHGVKTAS